jgi:hypothetical protein
MFELKDAERAVRYMADTDKSYASAKAKMRAMEERKKITLAACFLDSSGANVPERNANAITSQIYKAEVDVWEESILDYETIHAKRIRAEHVIDLFRSLNSARTKGVMT